MDRQAATRERLSGNLLALLARLWASLTTGPRYDDAQVRAFAQQAARASLGARTAASGAQEAYLRQVLTLLDTQPGRGLHVTIPDAPRGIDPVVQYTRPVEEFRRLRVSGLDEFEANERALRRLQLIGDTDVSLAVRDTSAQVLQFTPEVTGYRRVIHPELAKSQESCGLCIAASTRKYHVKELMPLHDRCNCGIVAITRRQDPGGAINDQSLSELYRLAGSTKAGDLAKVRYRVHEHGELGPVLRAESDEFRGPAEVRRATDRKPSSAADISVNPQAVLDGAERVIAGLLERQARGEAVSVPLAYQRGLADRMRARLNGTSASAA
jgi:hypothetical protein